MKNTILAFFLVFSSLSIAQVNFTSSNLPIVLLETNGQSIPDEPKLTANMKIIFNGEGQRNSVSDTQYEYNGFIGIELRGNSSQSFDQKQYAVETRDAAGENLNVSLLGMPKENDWVLYAPWNDISMIRNVIAYHLWDKMGHWGPRTRLCEVVLNGQYQGVYVLCESIKRDDGRVKTATLREEDISGRELTGGYIMKIDASNSEDDKSFTSLVPGVGTGFGAKTITWLYHYPDPKDIQPEQENYIHKYIDTVETLIQSANFDDPVEGYAKYLSLRSFIDYFIHTELSLNADGFKRSAYFYKEKQDENGGKGQLKAGPVWDYNLAYGNCNFCKGNQPNAWVYQGCETIPTPALWTRLLQDPNFVNALKCRYLELREGILGDEYINNFIDAYADTLNESQARHFQQWNTLLSDGSGGGGWNNPLWFSAYRVESYSEEITTIKNWLDKRLQFLDDNLQGECLITSANHERLAQDDYYLFPNPTNTVVVIETNETVQLVEIYNALGQEMGLVLNKSNTQRMVLKMFENYPSGIYTVRIYDDSGNSITKKVIKE